MTNIPSLAEELDIICEQASQHLLVTHAVDRGQFTRAGNLLDLRVMALFDAYSGGRFCDGLEDHIAPCLDTPGPLLFKAIKQAVNRRMEAMS